MKNIIITLTLAAAVIGTAGCENAKGAPQTILGSGFNKINKTGSKILPAQPGSAGETIVPEQGYAAASGESEGQLPVNEGGLVPDGGSVSNSEAEATLEGASPSSVVVCTNDEFCDEKLSIANKTKGFHGECHQGKCVAVFSPPQAIPDCQVTTDKTSVDVDDTFTITLTAKNAIGGKIFVGGSNTVFEFGKNKVFGEDDNQKSPYIQKTTLAAIFDDPADIDLGERIIAASYETSDGETVGTCETKIDVVEE